MDSPTPTPAKEELKSNTAEQSVEEEVSAPPALKPQELSLETLFKAGSHLGHRVSRWNPKMAPYIFTVRNKVHIINLEKTHEQIKKARSFVSELVAAGGVVLFIGTKRQAKELVKKHAAAAGMPYVVTRWLGGTLTNFKTIQRSIKKLSSLEELLESPEISGYTKKERLMLQRESAKKAELFGGLRALKKLPEAIFVADVDSDQIAVSEAQAAKVKIIGITDTDADPSGIDFPIPANDDSIKSLDLITWCIAEAVKEGKASAAEQGYLGGQPSAAGK